MPGRPPTPAEVGRAIRSLRESGARMSQQDLADAGGISQKYLSGIELGERNPTLNVLGALATALGVELSELIQRAERDR